MRFAAATWLALLAFALTVGLLRSGEVADEQSYRAGYAQASHPDFIRSVMSKPGATSASLCDALFERLIAHDEAGNLVWADFVGGCKHAVAEAME